MAAAAFSARQPWSGATANCQRTPLQGTATLPVNFGSVTFGSQSPQVFGGSVSRMSTTGSYPCAASMRMGMPRSPQPQDALSGAMMPGPPFHQTLPLQMPQFNTGYNDLLASIRNVAHLPANELFAAEMQLVSEQAIPSPLPSPLPPPIADQSMISTELYLPGEEPAPAAIPALGVGSGPAHASRQPAEVLLMVYILQSQGRRGRGTEMSLLPWKPLIGLLKDVIGIYHVGVSVREREFCFGNYYGKNSIRIGNEDSGICTHDPQKAGYLFKRQVSMGHTSLTAAQVETEAVKLADSAFQRRSYDRVNHNCMDFADAFASRLGVEAEQEAARWVYRAATTLRTWNGFWETGKADEEEADEGGVSTVTESATAFGIEGVETAPLAVRRTASAFPPALEGVGTAPSSSSSSRHFGHGAGPGGITSSPQRPDGVDTAPSARRISGLQPASPQPHHAAPEGLDCVSAPSARRAPAQPTAEGGAEAAQPSSRRGFSGLQPASMSMASSPMGGLEGLDTARGGGGMPSPPGPQGPSGTPPRAPARASSVDTPRPPPTAGHRRHPSGSSRGTGVPVRVEVVCGHGGHSRQSSSSSHQTMHSPMGMGFGGSEA